MPVTTRENVIAIAPELSSVAEGDARWELFLADAESELAAGVWGDKLERAARYLVAHWLTESVQRATFGTRGPIQSETVGGISRTYATASASSSSSSRFSTTAYGTEFLRLMRGVTGGGLTVSSLARSWP